MATKVNPNPQKDIEVIDIEKSNQNGRQQQTEKNRPADWTEADFNLLKSSVRKFNFNWKLIKFLSFPQKTHQEIRHAWGYLHRLKKHHGGSAFRSEKSYRPTHSHSSPVSSSSRKNNGVHEMFEVSSGSNDSDCEILDNESLPLSLVKKKVVSAAKSSSPIVVPKMSQQRFEDQDIEDVPLSKLKAMKSFEDYLKELPKDVKQIVNKTLKSYENCRECTPANGTERELRMQMEKLLPILNVLQDSKKMHKYSDIESRLVGHLTSEESKQLFRVTLKSARTSVSQKLTHLLHQFSSLVESEKEQWKEEASRFDESRSSGTLSSADSIEMLKKLESCQSFRHILRSLLWEYLNMFCVDSLSKPRIEVLKTFIADSIIPAWNTATCGQKAKLRGGVTVDAFLDISRQVLFTRMAPEKRKADSLIGRFQTTSPISINANKTTCTPNTPTSHTDQCSLGTEEVAPTDNMNEDSNELELQSQSQTSTSTAEESTTTIEVSLDENFNEDLDIPLASLKKPKS